MSYEKKRFYKTFMAVVCSLSLIMSGMFADISMLTTYAETEETLSEGDGVEEDVVEGTTDADDEQPTLWVAGSSRVGTFSAANYYYTRDSFVNYLGNYLDGVYNVQNVGAAGYSSKSYLELGQYQTLTSQIKAGDTLVIHFGFKDTEAGGDHYVSAVGDYQTEGSYSYYLYEYYVKIAQEAGAEVILCTPAVTRPTDGVWAPGNLYNCEAETIDGVYYERGDYAEAVRQLGEDVNVPVVDITTLSKELYDELGTEETQYLHAWLQNNANTMRNGLHSELGAKYIAWLFANAVQDMDVSLAAHVDLSAGAPDRATDLSVNPDYEELVYDNNLSNSLLWPDYVVDDVTFKGTVFGETSLSESYHTLGSDAEGNMHIATTGNKGKISGSCDGVAMYYYRIPADSKFVFSAKAKVNDILTSNKQVAFGLMARDDMYIDYASSVICSDYVVAGTLGTGCNCFYKYDTSLNVGDALVEETVAAGNTYDLRIEGNVNSYNCYFGKEPVQTFAVDSALKSIDSEYIYIGMFVARNADISYSDIYLEVDGELVIGDELEGDVTGGDVSGGNAESHTLWVVGGTYVGAQAASNYYYLRDVYTNYIADYLDDTYTVQNLGYAGHSAKSFLNTTNYSALLGSIQEGDTLLVNFGMKDGSPDSDYYSNANGDYQTKDSFAYYLYEYYVKIAQEAGANVILATPMAVRSDTSEWLEGDLHNTTDKTFNDVFFEGGDYPAAIRQLGQDINVPVVDLTTISKDMYDELGVEENRYLNAWRKNDISTVYKNSLNKYGAKMMAWLFANAVDDLETPVASHVDLTAGKPDKESNMTPNPNYVELVYDRDLAVSKLWEDYTIDGVAFKGTVFGDFGSDKISRTYETLETDADGNMHMAVYNDNGKISGSSDGLAMYYYRIPADSEFVLSATANVTAIDNTNNQVAFGLMARDDMYIDTVSVAVDTDYVVAGTLGRGCNSFYRQDSALGGKASLTSETIAAGNTYDLCIVGNADGYSCYFGDEPVQNYVMESGLKTVDSEYIYIGMIAARNVDVTYSNIYLEVDGQVLIGEAGNGDESDGDITGGDESDGDITGGDESDGDITGGDESDGDITGGDESDGDAEPHTLWVVGGTYVGEQAASNYFYLRDVYPKYIGDYLDDLYTVQNLGYAGHSAKSFMDTDKYTTMLEGIQKGDTLLVSFGMKDGNPDSKYYLNANGDYQTKDSFAYYLYEYYVKLAQEAGANVILATPIVVRTDTAEWPEGSLHKTGDKTINGVFFEGGDYSEAIRQLGQDVNVPVVDLTSTSKFLYDQMGLEEGAYLNAWRKNNVSTVYKNSLNMYGAKVMAYLFAKAVEDLDTPIAAHLDLSAGIPDKESNMVPNPDYIELVYDRNLPTSKLWEDYTIDGVTFKGTVFGDFGSDKINTTYEALETDADGNMHMAVYNNNGKISGSSDGLAMYYYRIPAGSEFEFSATADIDSIDNTNNQVAFGLMARDDMYIDTVSVAVDTDYVVAGTLGRGCNGFYRNAGELGGKAALTSETIAAGKTYDLCIKGNADGYSCYFGNEPVQNYVIDSGLKMMDSEYIYIGMIAVRNVDVTYSNIYLEVDGQVLIENKLEKVEFEKEPVLSTEGNLEAPTVGDVLTVDYTLKGVEEEDDASVVYWYRVKDNSATLIEENAEKTYTVTSEDVGYSIRVAVLPKTAEGLEGTIVTAESGVVVAATEEEPEEGTGDGEDKEPEEPEEGTGDEDKVINTEGLKVRLVNPDQKYTYTGTDIKPAILVTNNGEELVEGVDYTVKYSNNINASVEESSKKPLITITAKNNLTGTTSTSFEIQPKSLKDGDVVIGSVVVAEGSKATPILIYNGVKLTTKDFDNKDAQKKYSENGEMTIDGKGNYTDTIKIPVTVVPKSELKKFAVNVDTKTKLTYNGKAQIPEIKVVDKSDKHVLSEEDYTIVFSTSNVNAGIVKFTVIGMGKYTGTVSKTYRIRSLMLKEGLEYSGVNPNGYTYNKAGVTINDDLVVKHGDIVLVEGKDYKITYSNNKKISTNKSLAKFTIKFMGNYNGSKALKGTFKITSVKLTDDTDGLKIVIPDKVYSGKPGTYTSKPYVSIDGVSLKKSDYKVFYYSDEAMTKEIKGKNKLEVGKDQAFATVYVKIVGKGNYAHNDDKLFAKAQYKVYRKDGKVDISKAKVTFMDEKGNVVKKSEYTGHEVELTVKVEVKVGKNYEVVDPANYTVAYDNNVNKGTATVVINATGDKYVGSKTANFKVVAQNLKDHDPWKK